MSIGASDLPIGKRWQSAANRSLWIQKVPVNTASIDYALTLDLRAQIWTV